MRCRQRKIAQGSFLLCLRQILAEFSMNETPHTGIALINPEDVRSIISSAEAALKACWEKLTILQTRQISKKQRLEIFISFQPELLSTLVKLESLYNAICENERQVRANAAVFRKGFPDEITRIKRYKELLDGIIDVGKSIGDAFAWIFHLHNRPLLRKHYEHQFIPRLPTRIGGTGELEFIRNCQMFGRYFALSHSITTFLRVGDISLIDPTTLHIAAIGELKTVKKSATEIITTVVILGGRKLRRNMFPKPHRKTSREPSRANWDARFSTRLEKQVKNMKAFFKKNEPALTPEALEMSLSFPKLDKLFKASSEDNWGNVQVGRGLLLIGVRSRDTSWAEQVDKVPENEGEIYKCNMDRIPRQAQVIVDKDLSDNSLIIDSMFYPAKGRYELELKMRPLFWWPLSLETREAIAFQKMRVMTLYNPAFFIKALREAGFDVESNKGSDLHVTRKYRNGCLKIVGMRYLYKLLQTHLFKEETIVKMLQKAVQKVEKVQIKQSTYVALDFDFAFQ
jgi:hypothetical protein